MQSVIEKFPHDALIPLESAEALTDTTLSSSVSALKTSNSVKSINSLKRRRLTEIAEDASEIPLPDTQPATPLETPTQEVNKSFSKSESLAIAEDPHNNISTSTTKAIRKSEETGSSVVNSAAPKSSPSSTVVRPAKRPSIDDRSNELETRPSLAISDYARPSTSNSLHNSFSQPSETYAYLYKPKVKLAPRPVIESRHSSPFVRPTSSLPAGIQMQPRDQSETFTPTGTQGLPKLPKIPRIVKEAYTNGHLSPSAYNTSAYDPRPVSRGSIATMPANIRYTEDSKLTPEKKRLMKALQKRKQQQQARQLAKEAELEKTDLVPGVSQDNSFNYSKIASSLASVHPPLPEGSKKPTSSSHIVPTESGIVAYGGTIQLKIASDDESADLTTTLSSHPDSQTKAINSVRNGENQLENGALPTIERSEAPTKDYLGSPSVPTGDLQSFTSILQFPNWSGAEGSSRKTVPGSAPMNILNAIPDQDDTTGISNGLMHGERVQPNNSPSTPASIFKPLAPESSDHDLPKEGQTTTTPTETSAASISQLETNQTQLISLTQSHDTKDFSTSLKDSESVHKPEHELVTSKVDRDDLQELRTHPDEMQLDDIRSNLEHIQIAPSGAIPETLSQIPHNESRSIHTSDNHRISPLVDVLPNDESASIEEHNQAATGNHIDINPIPQSREMQEIYSEGLLLSKAPYFMERKSRPPPITPVRNSATHSKAPSSSDVDSLLEELHGATLQEATSIVLVKTPTAPYFPTFSQPPEVVHKVSTSSDDSSPTTPRLHSTKPIREPISTQHSSSESEAVPHHILTREALTSMSRTSTRDVSPQFPISIGNTRTLSRQSSLSPNGLELERPSSRKSTVSSLISQRIRAFEDKFATASSPQQTPTSAVRAQIVTLRKVSLNTPSSAKSATLSPSSRNASSPYPSPSPSPHNFVQRFGFGKNVKKENLPVGHSSQDTVSKLNQGVVENRSAIAVAPETPIKASDIKEKRRSFFSSSKSRKKKTNSISSTTSTQKEGRLSPDIAGNHMNASRRSNSPDSVEHSKSRSSLGSFVSEGEKRESKKKPGLLKRLSGLGSNTHRSIAETINEPLNEEASKDTQSSSVLAKWNSSVTVGELNIQFPDTLVCIYLASIILLTDHYSYGSEDMLKLTRKASLSLPPRSQIRIPKCH